MASSTTTATTKLDAAIPPGGYDRSTERADSYILPTLEKAFGENKIQSYQILDRIIQPNAVGFKLELEKTTAAVEDTNDNDDTDIPSQVFLKQVIATDYQANRNDWSDLRRTLLYARTELRFYRDMLPAMMEKKNFRSAPIVYYVEYDFDGWINEDEHATQAADMTIDTDQLPDPLTKGGWLVLECVSGDTHFQDSPLTIAQAEQCLEAAANLHASAWEDKALLAKADQELSRAAFNLQMRNPKELAGIVTSWDHFCTAFHDDLVANNLWTASIQNLGQRMEVLAEYVSQQTTPSPNDKYATVIHGDYKAMNIMMGTTASSPTIMIDFASASCGNGFSDVAMHIHHAVNPEDLANGGEERLVNHYLKKLRDAVGCDYPDDVAWRHYKLAVVDYARFFMGRMWKTATPETMAQKSKNKNIANINRSIPSAMAFIGRVDKYLGEIEEEYEIRKSDDSNG